jgi:RNA polymerase sigma-70 factor (ECF subfamily)
MTTEEFKNRVLPIKDKLFRLARRILNDTEESEDVTQEIFYRLWARRNELENYRSIEAFAMVMTKNLCLDKIKSKHHQKAELTEWNAPVDYHSPQKLIELKEDVSNVHRFIQQLPEQQRMIIQMRDVEGFEFEEIAEILEMNLNAVRVNLSRARKAIREQMMKKHDYEYKRN